MSKQIKINIIPDQSVFINPITSSQGINITPDQNVIINPITLNQGVINHSVTHQSGSSDELLHNLLGGLQGGLTNQYYHISSGQYFNLTTGDVVRPSETGQFYPMSNPSGFTTGGDLSLYATKSFVTGVSGVLQTQITNLNNQTGSYTLKTETGLFYPRTNPSGYITGVNLTSYATISYVTGVSGSLQTQITNLNNKTGSYILNSQTGQFYSSSNPSGYITGIDLSSYVLDSETGNFITINETGQFYSSSNPNEYTSISYVTGISGDLQSQIITLNDQLPSFYPRSNPSGYITGVSNVVFTIGDQNINGTKNFTTRPTVNSIGVVLRSETGNFLIHSDLSLAVFTTGNQTISGTKTFATGLTIQSTSNQLTLRTGSAGSAISITAPTINANRIYTLPDAGAPASFLLTAGQQTIVSLKNFTVRPTVNTTGVALVSEITNLVYTTGDQKVSGIKTFGENNNIYNSAHSHILGGEVNIISGVTGSGLGAGNVTSYTGCFIGGGNKNDIISANYSFIGGGQNNHISGVTGTGVLGNVFIDRVFYSTVVGGLRNDIFKNYGSIAGGQDNTISGDHSFIGAGRFNSGFGDYSVIVGGDKNLIESNVDFGSILGGRRALINSNHNGATILTDGQDRDHISKGSHTCSLDFASGVYLRLPSFTGVKNQTGNLGELKVSGEYLYIATGQNTWGRIQISTF